MKYRKWGARKEGRDDDFIFDSRSLPSKAHTAPVVYSTIKIPSSSTRTKNSGLPPPLASRPLVSPTRPDPPPSDQQLPSIIEASQSPDLPVSMLPVPGPPSFDDQPLPSISEASQSPSYQQMPSFREAPSFNEAPSFKQASRSPFDQQPPSIKQASQPPHLPVAVRVNNFDGNNNYIIEGTFQEQGCIHQAADDIEELFGCGTGTNPDMVMAHELSAKLNQMVDPSNHAENEDRVDTNGVGVRYDCENHRGSLRDPSPAQSSWSISSLMEYFFSASGKDGNRMLGYLSPGAQFSSPKGQLCSPGFQPSNCHNSHPDADDKSHFTADYVDSSTPGRQPEYLPSSESLSKFVNVKLEERQTMSLNQLTTMVHDSARKEQETSSDAPGLPQGKDFPPYEQKKINGRRAAAVRIAAVMQRGGLIGDDDTIDTGRGSDKYKVPSAKSIDSKLP